MKLNRIGQVSLLASVLILLAAGAPLAVPAQAAGSQPPAQAPNAVSNGVLFTDKQVSQAQARWGDTLFYTITLTNTFGVSPLPILMTDTVPAALVTQPNTLWASQGALTDTAGVLTWSGSITPSGVISLGFQAKVAAVNTTITNVAVVDAGVDGIVLSPVVQTVVGPAMLYLPVVARPPAGIFGRVMEHGSPAPNVPLGLWFYNGSAWSMKASLSTGADGSYLFSPPALLSGQKYGVLFANENDSSRLYVWSTRQLTAYKPGDSVSMGDFDVANIELKSPASGATVALPYTFQWAVRSATPTDSYEFNLVEPNTGEPWFWTDPPLGYTGSYILSKLPAGFSTGTTYIWYMWVYDTNGGYGISYWSYYVRFSNAGVALPSTPNLDRVRTADLPGQPIEGK